MAGLRGGHQNMRGTRVENNVARACSKGRHICYTFQSVTTGGMGPPSTRLEVSQSCPPPLPPQPSRKQRGRLAAQGGRTPVKARSTSELQQQHQQQQHATTDTHCSGRRTCTSSTQTRTHTYVYTHAHTRMHARTCSAARLSSSALRSSMASRRSPSISSSGSSSLSSSRIYTRSGQGIWVRMHGV